MTNKIQNPKSKIQRNLFFILPLLSTLYSLLFLILGCGTISAQQTQETRSNMPSSVVVEPKKYDLSNTSSENLTLSAWEALGNKDYEGVFVFTDKCIQLHQVQAEKEEASLRTFANTGREFEYATLNDVATCYFIRGKALWQEGKLEEAKKELQVIVDKFPYAQSWDPKGWFWKVAEVAKDDIKKIDKEIQEKKPKQ